METREEKEDAGRLKAGVVALTALLVPAVATLASILAVAVTSAGRLNLLVEGTIGGFLFIGAVSFLSKKATSWWLYWRLVGPWLSGTALFLFGGTQFVILSRFGLSLPWGSATLSAYIYVVLSGLTVGLVILSVWALKVAGASKSGALIPGPEVASTGTPEVAPLPPGLVERGEAQNTGDDDRLSTVLITAAVAVVSTIAVVAGFIALGLNGAYSTRVIDQAAQPEEKGTVYRDWVELVDSGEPICGDGEDYNVCTSLHVGMYNSVCAGGPAMTLGRFPTCSRLDEWVDEMLERDQANPGALTQAGPDGTWGANYLRPRVARRQGIIKPEVEEISHVEHCHFKLGPITLGECDR